MAIKTVIKRVFLGILLIFIAASFWDRYVVSDYQKGVAAYKSGDYATALSKLTPVAEDGDADAQFRLGWMYHDGQGVAQDYQTAMKWYKLSAEQGDETAQYNLGVMYDNGQGVTEDDKTAVKWYKLSAEQGDETAQYNLGVMYYNGTGVPKDNVYAHMWYNIAAVNGDEDAPDDRDSVADDMTSSDISKAQKLAQECISKKYKDC